MENLHPNAKITLCSEVEYQLGICFYILTKSDPKDRLFVTISYDQTKHEMIIDKDREFKSTVTLSKTYQIYKSIPFEHASTCPCYQMNINPDIYSFSSSNLFVKLASCVLVLDSKNRLLLTRRSRDLKTFPSCWVNPGGRLDKGESLEHCALREVEEEVGLKLEKKIGPEGGLQLYYSGVECEFKHFMAYESVYPSMLDLGLPKAQNLCMFYYLKIGHENNKIKVKVQEDEVDKAIWIPLATLKSVIEGKSDTNEISCFSIGNNGLPQNDVMPKEYLEGVYPNNLKEGLGEGHLRAIRNFCTFGLSEKKEVSL